METKLVKWAIYRGKIGHYAMMLVETLADAEDLMCYPVFKKEPGRLPVIINRMGGMTGFDPYVKNYVETRILPEDERPLKLDEEFPVDSADFATGFISPDGTTVSCAKGCFMECAEAICVHYFEDRIYPEKFLLEEKGWVSVMDLEDKLYVSYESHMSPKQADVIKGMGIERFHPNIANVLRRAEKSWEEDENA